MSYSEKDGQVVLTMSRDDHCRMLVVFAEATNAVKKRDGNYEAWEIVQLLNRLNEGNPNYTPYEVTENK